MKSSFSSLDKIEFAKSALREKKLHDAYNGFKSAVCLYGCAYCKLLNGELNEAKNLLESLENSSSFVNWLLILIEIIEGKKDKMPTYFQIRNFYEQDVEMLFFYERYDFISKIFQKTSYLANFNMEVYKYNARLLLNQGYLADSEILIKKSLDICFKDPETHYMYGELLLKRNDIEKAKQEFQKAIRVNGTYYPSLIKLKELT